MRPPVRTVSSLAVLVVVALGGSACGGEAADGGQSAGSAATTATAKVIDVTFDGDTVTPNGDRISVGVDQPIELKVTADQAGEIHVHSSPEQELEYAAGKTTLTLTLDKPGLVEVESHALDKTIVQLEVK